MENSEQRFIDIEMALSNLERMVDDLNDVIIKQGKDIAFFTETESLFDRSDKEHAKRSKTIGRRNAATALLVRIIALENHFQKKIFASDVWKRSKKNALKCAVLK